MEERDDYPIIPQPSKDKDRAINNNKEFLNWIYERMICVHGERDLYDYMINFKSIIDSQQDQEELKKELASLKEVVKELIPIAEEMRDLLAIKNGFSEESFHETGLIIERAKRLSDNS